MRHSPTLFVTGKGGSGKTTIAYALARAVAARGGRVLLVEAQADASILRLFEQDGELGNEPRSLAVGVDGAAWQPRGLVEAYFSRLLRIPLLSRRLLSSTSFNALTAAAPGVSEFLALNRLHDWARSGTYDRIIVDGPATGHAMQLLRAPAQLAALAPRGPLSAPLRRLRSMLRDPAKSSVAVLSLCEEMSIAEATEARARVSEIGMRCERPVLNRCAPTTFTARDGKAIRELTADHPEHPLLVAAQRQIAAQKRTARFASTLRREFDATPIKIADRENANDEEIAASMTRGLAW